jgi:alkylhydroperoxidase/carboxymuconolactone decarboxylase family protein YurZ
MNDPSVERNAGINGLDPKTSTLIQIGIIAALGLESSMPLHIALARGAGATRQEVISAMMIGLPGSDAIDPDGRMKTPDSYEVST